MHYSKQTAHSLNLTTFKPSWKTTLLHCNIWYCVSESSLHPMGFHVLLSSSINKYLYLLFCFLHANVIVSCTAHGDTFIMFTQQVLFVVVEHSVIMYWMELLQPLRFKYKMWCVVTGSHYVNTFFLRFGNDRDSTAKSESLGIVPLIWAFGTIVGVLLLLLFTQVRPRSGFNKVTQCSLYIKSMPQASLSRSCGKLTQLHIYSKM